MSRDDPQRDHGRDGPEKECKAFVGGISWHMTDRELKDNFRKFNAKHASVMLDKMTNRSRGFGFVTFDSDEDLKEACRQMHDSDLDGRKISCTMAVPQAETAPGTPASALAGGAGPSRSGRYGGPDRHRDRSYERAPERPPPRGYAGRAYDDRRYDRGGYGASYRQPERGYDRGGYPPAEYDRGYDRGYPPPAYSYEREGYGGGYGREPAGYSRDGYPPERGYSGAAGYGEAGYGERGTYGSGYGGGGYDRGYDDRAYAPRDVYNSRGAAPARETAYSRPGPERDYGRPAARAAGPYDRAAGSLPPR